MTVEANVQTERRFAVTRRAGNEGEYAIELMLYDTIGADAWTGGGITSKQVADELKKHRDAEKIYVRINSPGGFVDEGHAIYNQLKRHKAEIIVTIDGMALSAASVVAMAGDEVEMAANAMMMIHKSWNIVIGNADDLRKAADVAAKIDGTIAGVYAARAGGEVADWLAAMGDETWYTAEEAVEAHLADRVGDEAERAAAWANLGRFHNVPDWARQRIKDTAEGGHGSPQNNEETEMTKEQEEAAIEAARNEATKAERDRIGAIDRALAGDPYANVRSKAIEEGMTLEAAKAEAFDAVVERIEELKAELGEAKGKLEAVASGGVKPLEQKPKDDQVEAEARAKAEAEANDPAVAYDAKVRAMIASGMKAGKAHAQAQHDDPEGYEAWLDRANKRGKYAQ